MKHLLYPMDTCFFSSMGRYSFRSMCEMSAEAGFDAVYLSVTDERSRKLLPLLKSVKKNHGIHVAGVWTAINLAEPDLATQIYSTLKIISHLPANCDLELAFYYKNNSIPNSSPRGDDRACRFLEPLLDKLTPSRHCIHFYPHIHFWGERLEDGIRLWKKLGHPAFKTTFCGFHWYATGDRKSLDTLICAAAPSLHSVNFCGTRKSLNDQTTIEHLDHGEMDHFMALSILRYHGYTGKIGIQGWGRGGDVYAGIQRDLQTFRHLESRVNTHPNWALPS